MDRFGSRRVAARVAGGGATTGVGGGEAGTGAERGRGKACKVTAPRKSGLTSLVISIYPPGGTHEGGAVVSILHLAPERRAAKVLIAAHDVDVGANRARLKGEIEKYDLWNRVLRRHPTTRRPRSVQMARHEGKAEQKERGHRDPAGTEPTKGRMRKPIELVGGATMLERLAEPIRGDVIGVFETAAARWASAFRLGPAATSANHCAEYRCWIAMG